MLAAFDPGKGGGVAYYDGTEVFLYPFKTESTYLEIMEGFDRNTKALVEDVPSYVSSATSNSSSFKLGYNMGFIMGALRAYAFSVDLIGPKVWQKGQTDLKPKQGYTERKRLLKDNAIRLYPRLKGITNATADALLILHYGLKRHNIDASTDGALHQRHGLPPVKSWGPIFREDAPGNAGD